MNSPTGTQNRAQRRLPLGAKRVGCPVRFNALCVPGKDFNPCYYSIGIDLGGTQIRAVWIDRAGQIQAHQRVATAATSGPQVVIGQIEQLIAAMVGALDRTEIIGIGVASPGPVDLRTGVALQAPTIAGWFNMPLQALLEERTGLRVELRNDANMAALGEWRCSSHPSGEPSPSGRCHRSVMCPFVRLNLATTRA
ncbi:MAG: ROK family protein [Caldilineaceae bacterium]